MPQSHFFLKREGYCLEYEGRLRQPAWVCEVLSRDSINGTVKRDRFSFLEDKELPSCVRSTLKDYRKSGYDRGHMAAAANNKGSEKAMKDTFLLSNMSPQNPQLNRGYWAKLEKHVRELTNKYDIVRVITGPLFLPYQGTDGKKYVTYQVIGDNNVAVPTHFFKVITAENGLSKEQWAYVMPNKRIDKSTPLSDFKTTVSKVEKMAEIVFQR